MKLTAVTPGDALGSTLKTADGKGGGIEGKTADELKAIAVEYGLELPKLAPTPIGPGPAPKPVDELPALVELLGRLGYLDPQDHLPKHPPTLNIGIEAPPVTVLL